MQVMTNININNNEITNAVISGIQMKPMTSAPTNPKEGEFYYNSTEGKAFQYVNGEWKAMGGASGVVYTITPTAEQTDDVAAINAVVTKPEVGDIAIVKRQIAGEKYTHSTYIYDKTNGWIAADGSYNAQNVYFGEDLLTTTAIGNISLTDGQATIPVTGSNLIEAFNTIYVKETNTGLKTGSPTASVNGSITYCEIGSTNTQTVKVSMSDDGSYKYGYTTETGEEGTKATTTVNDGTTGVVVNATTPYSLTFDGVAVSPTTTNGDSFLLSPAVQTTKKSMSVIGTVNYQQGNIPVSNLKKMYPAQRIDAGSVSTSTSERFRWYIPMYQGFTYSDTAIADPANITAAQLTSLGAPSTSTVGNNISKVVGEKAYNNTKIITATAPKAWRQYFIAFPDSYGWTMKNAKDGNNIDCTVSKAGNVTITYGSGDTAIDVVYRVYYINNAADYGTLKISWTLA